MRTRLVLVAAVLILGCDRGERAELQQQNAELKAEKAELEKALAQSRAEAEKLQAAQAAAAAPPTPPPATRDADDPTLMAAQDAYVHGQYARAIALAKQATASDPSKAWRIVGAANCFLRDRAGARAAFDKLGAQERSFLKYVCQRNNVKLD